MIKKRIFISSLPGLDLKSLDERITVDKLNGKIIFEEDLIFDYFLSYSRSADITAHANKYLTLEYNQQHIPEDFIRKYSELFFLLSNTHYSHYVDLSE